MENEEQLVRLGNEAETLLGSDVFDKTINDLVNQSFQTFCNTKPDDAEGREIAYHHYRAIVEIVHTLQQRVSVRDEITVKANKQQEDS
tara:strand:+ start:294 stop:557 length:264 start_codon:yes stop_codon:yes gene_type:complete